MIRSTCSLALFALLCFGCAQTNPHPQDPFERINRVTFSFNQAVDATVVKPAAYVYLKYIPQPIPWGIGNFFDNLRQLPTIVNDLLQAKFHYAAQDTTRFFINTTLGVGGIFDPALKLGLEPHKEDLGHTLYLWGYRHSTYLILPFFGPSTVRDTIGFGVDYYAFSIWPWVSPHTRVPLLGLDYFDKRSRILRKGSILDTVAVDKYVFMRDAYFQNRQYSFNETSDNDDDQDIHAEDPYHEEILSEG